MLDFVRGTISNWNFQYFLEKSMYSSEDEVLDDLGVESGGMDDVDEGVRPYEFERHPKKKRMRDLVSDYNFAPCRRKRTGKVSNGSMNSGVEWSEEEVFVLLEMWGDRFLQLGRKSLRSKDWNEVVENFSEAMKVERTEVQCRTMVDSLKKKYKKEKEKMEKTNSNSRRWPYYKKMDMLMASSPRQECGLTCGFDSGEFVFMNTKVYLDRSNGFDEMRDSPGESESSEEDEEFPASANNFRGNSSLNALSNSIQRFGEIYDTIETSKRQHMMELEKMRMEFHRELELQKKQIMKRAEAELEKIQKGEEEENEEEEEEEEEDDDEDDDNDDEDDDNDDEDDDNNDDDGNDEDGDAPEECLSR